MIPGVPYDAEIEYLESTGTQWIDTPDIPANSETHRIEATGYVTNPTKGDYAIISIYSAGGFGWNYTCYGNKRLHVYFNFGKYLDIDSPTEYSFSIQNNGYKFSIELNGATYSASAPTSWRDNPKPVCLLNRPDNHSQPAVAGCRISRYKLWLGSTLVRDFIPVRVGQTGYMYDRVSRTLFGNNGTGSFVLGPDVSKPVMGLYGMRKLYSAMDYVKNGLVAMWDGVDNAGWGVHDPEAAVWRDLTGNGYDGVVGSSVQVETNAMLFAGVANSANVVDLGYSWFGTPANITVEVAANCIDGVRYANCLFGGYGSTSESWLWHFFRMNNGAAISQCMTASGSVQIYHGNMQTIGPKCFSLTVDSSEMKAYKFGVLSGRANSGGGMNWSKPKAKCAIGAHGRTNGGFDYAFKGRVYNARVYNRALTAEEVAHNYAIDKARFNLP